MPLWPLPITYDELLMRATLQSFAPVQQYRHLRGTTILFGRLQEQEFLAAGCDVEHPVTEREESNGRIERQAAGRRLNRNGHYLAFGRGEEQLLAVTSPSGFFSSVGGNLPAVARVWKALDEDIAFA